MGGSIKGVGLPKFKRGGYIFVTWIGDHSPYHVHVFQDGREILKYDLENYRVMSGRVNSRLLKIIRDLVKEGVI